MNKIFLDVNHNDSDIKIELGFFVKRISQKLYKACAYRKWGLLNDIINNVTMSSDNGLLRIYAGVFCILLYVLCVQKSYKILLYEVFNIS